MTCPYSTYPLSYTQWLEQAQSLQDQPEKEAK